MRAMIFANVGAAEITTRPDPQPGPGEVRVRVATAGLCAGDL